MLNGLRAHGKSSGHRYNPFTQDVSPSDVTPGPGTAADTPDTSDPITQDSELEVAASETPLSYNRSPRVTRQDVTDGLSTSDSTPVHVASQKTGGNANFSTYTENNSELEVIR